MNRTADPATLGRDGARPPAGGGRSPLAWLQTREGKLTAGAAAVVLVLVLALRKRAGGAPFTPEQAATGPDGTIQGQLDELTGRGGTLEELRDVITGVAGQQEQIRDLLEAQNPAAKAATVTPTLASLLAKFGYNSASQLWAVRNNYVSQTQERVARLRQLQKNPGAPGNPARIKQLTGQIGSLQHAVGIVNSQIRQIQALPR
jgi:hypothetical protein